jgi:hypothetical protein
LGAVFRGPFHRTQPARLAALTLFRPQAPSVQGFVEPPRQTVGHVFDTLLVPLPSPPRATNFGSSSSVPKMDLSRSTLRAMAGGIWRMLFPSGFRPSLPSRPPSLSLGVYSLFSQIHVSSHGRTIITIPACLFPPTLDDSRFPRRGVDGTGEISCR